MADFTGREKKTEGWEDRRGQVYQEGLFDDLSRRVSQGQYDIATLWTTATSDPIKLQGGPGVGKAPMPTNLDQRYMAELQAARNKPTLYERTKQYSPTATGTLSSNIQKFSAFDREGNYTPMPDGVIEITVPYREGDDLSQGGGSGKPIPPAMIGGKVVEAQIGAKGKTRDLPIKPELKAVLTEIGEELGVNFEVYSGGQAGKGSGGKRTGSTRHDHGNAADVKMYTGTGNNKKYISFQTSQGREMWKSALSMAVQRGAKGVGAGVDYMGEYTAHIGYGKPGAWGAGGRSANTPSWVKEAWQAGIDGKPIRVAQKAPTPAAPITRKGQPYLPKTTQISGTLLGYSGSFASLTASSELQAPVPAPRLKRRDGQVLASIVNGTHDTLAAINAKRDGVPLPRRRPQEDPPVPKDPFVRKGIPGTQIAGAEKIGSVIGGVNSLYDVITGVHRSLTAVKKNNATPQGPQGRGGRRGFTEVPVSGAPGFGSPKMNIAEGRSEALLQRKSWFDQQNGTAKAPFAPIEITVPYGTPFGSGSATRSGFSAPIPAPASQRPQHTSAVQAFKNQGMTSAQAYAAANQAAAQQAWANSSTGAGVYSNGQQVSSGYNPNWASHGDNPHSTPSYDGSNGNVPQSLSS